MGCVFLRLMMRERIGEGKQRCGLALMIAVIL